MPLIMLTPIVAALFLLLAPHAEAQHAARGADGVLRVGTKVSEPFVIRRSDGSLTGLSIELWNEIADRLDVEFELVELDLDSILDGVASGDLDVGIAAISVTPQREARIDFSHAYFASALGIAVRAGDDRSGFLRGLLALLTPGFWIAVGSLALVLLVVGVFAWLAERKRNAEQFGGGLIKGVGNGFWFSAVTMTTVGYGDKAPRTPAGRFIALAWMLASIIIISAFTGAIASAITAASLATGVRGPEDLTAARVGTLALSASDAALRERGIAARGFSTVEDALVALEEREIDAVVHDAPILGYAIEQSHAGSLRVLDTRFNFRPYAIAVPEGSAKLERVNRTLLEVIESAEWRDRIRAWGWH